jgi:RNA-binding protein 8A
LKQAAGNAVRVSVCAQFANCRSNFQGYALIEYATLEEARAAIDGMHEEKLLDQTVQVDFAFVRPPPNQNKGNRQSRVGGGRRGRSRSRSPEKQDRDREE